MPPSPSSLDSKSSWKPRQTPRTGRPRPAASLTASPNPEPSSSAAAGAKAPTPGSTTPSLPATTRGSGVITASAPARASARSTLRRLPTP